MVKIWHVLITHLPTRNTSVHVKYRDNFLFQGCLVGVSFTNRTLPLPCNYRLHKTTSGTTIASSLMTLERHAIYLSNRLSRSLDCTDMGAARNTNKLELVDYSDEFGLAKQIFTVEAEIPRVFERRKSHRVSIFTAGSFFTPCRENNPSASPRRRVKIALRLLANFYPSNCFSRSQSRPARLLINGMIFIYIIAYTHHSEDI